MAGKIPYSTTEVTIASRLLRIGHLGAVERRELPVGTVPAGLLRSLIEEWMQTTDWFPENLGPGTPFDGRLIHRNDDGSFSVYWKVESGVMRFEMKEFLSFSSCREAVRHFVSLEYRDGIDGIPIDLEA